MIRKTTYQSVNPLRFSMMISTESKAYDLVSLTATSVAYKLILRTISDLMSRNFKDGSIDSR